MRSIHRNVWPEVLEALKGIGIERMEIFRIGNHLFMYCTAPDDFDPSRDFQSYTSSKRAEEWNDLIDDLSAKGSGSGTRRLVGSDVSSFRLRVVRVMGVLG